LNGTAPIDASSGDHARHRLSRAGNRQINRVLHIMATVQLRNPGIGRDYFDRKKATGKTSMEAMRCLKRRLSDVVYRAMLEDAIAHTTDSRTGPGGHRGTSLTSSAAGSHPRPGTSVTSRTRHPRPYDHPARRVLTQRGARSGCLGCARPSPYAACRPLTLGRDPPPPTGSRPVLSGPAARSRHPLRQPHPGEPESLVPGQWRVGVRGCSKCGFPRELEG